jgi:STE24 endopeptidase
MSLVNPWFLAGLIGLVVFFHVRLAAEIMNLSRLPTTPPDALKDEVTTADCRQAAAYQIADTKLSCIQQALALGLGIGFWLCGGYGWVQGQVDALGLSPIWSGVVTLGALSLAGSLYALPFDWWSTFRVEAAFEMNKTTLGTFIQDRVTGLLLTAALGIPLLWVVLWFFYTTEWAALWAWVTLSVFGLAMTWLGPRLIMPLYMKFTPLEDGALKQAILKLAQKLNFPVKDIAIVDGSRRSTKANAFFAGFGNTRRIALFDTLRANHTDEEILAVLAHEIGHAKLKHVPQQIVIGLAQSGLMLWLLHVALRDENLYAAFQVRPGDVAMGMALFMLVYGAWSWLLEAPLQIITRRHEFQADAFAKAAVGAAQPMVRCLKKLSRDHLAHLAPHPFYVWLHHSHPPVVQRIEALES